MVPSVGRGGGMTDWQTEEVGVQVDAAGLVKPPVALLGTTILIAAVSVASIFLTSAIGYVIAVCASILGGVTALQDQKRRGHPSYVTFGWFAPILRSIRYAILMITLIHVARLAIAAAEGSGLFW